MSQVIPIAPRELKARLAKNDPLFLLDCREPDEREIASLGGVLIPMQETPARLEEIPRDKEIVVYCRSGGRSQKVAEFLLSNGYERVANLTGGILKWSDDVDPTVKKY